MTLCYLNKLLFYVKSEYRITGTKSFQHTCLHPQTLIFKLCTKIYATVFDCLIFNTCIAFSSDNFLTGKCEMCVGESVPYF